MTRGTCRRRLSGGAAAAVALPVWLLWPHAAFAHASDRGHVLLLPTGHYIVGGALAVAASFLVLAFVPPGAVRRVLAARLELGTVDERWRLAGSACGLLLTLLLVVAGHVGSRDPLSNPLPLTVWTLLWVGVTLLHGLIGNIWAVFNPWYAPWRLAVAVRLVPEAGLLRLPRRVDCWPAVILLLGFAWFELVYPAPEDPAVLARVVTTYGMVTFAAILVFGFDGWSRRGEFLGLFFRMIGRFGVVGIGEAVAGRRPVSLHWPGGRLAEGGRLTTAATLFLLAALASVSFDSLSRTFLWLGANGINPLELPGRTALLGINTAGLLLSATALAGLYYGCVALGLRLEGSRMPLASEAGRLVWSIVPISLAYHLSHYLVLLLVNGQYALVAWSDPFAMGWNLFGTAGRPVEAALVAGAGGAWLVWNIQAAAIVAGHVAAVLIAHMLANPSVRRRSIMGELPLTLLMIGYTALGLWLLSTPSAG